MSEFTRRAIIVVTAADRLLSNELALTYDPVGGERTFTVPLSPTGIAPATHYWANMACTRKMWQDFRARETTDRTIYSRKLYDGLTNNPETILSALGLKRIIDNSAHERLL